MVKLQPGYFILPCFKKPIHLLKTCLMIQIGDKLVSLELFEQKFICDLPACKGACCVQGDAGAPVSEDERDILDREYTHIKEFMTPGGRESVEELGKWVSDGDGDYVTPLNKGKECAYTVFENGIARCGIEKAWLMGKTGFRKPVSCHLYPVRVTRLGSLLALNYHNWNICQPARILGKREGIKVFRFLKEPLIRAYGEEFFRELEEVEKAMEEKRV